MATTTSKLTSAPTWTSDHLKDIAGWLKKDDYVVVHNKFKDAHFFHKCLGGKKGDEETTAFFKNHRVIYIDIASDSELLDGPKWEKYMKRAGSKECTCSLRGRVSNLKKNDLPYSYHIPLDY